jgi:hypothetical protein
LPVEGATRAPIIAAGIGDHWVQFRRLMDGPHGGIDEMWMPSEPCWPRIILQVYPRPRGEEGAADRDTFMRTVLTLHVDPKPYPLP